MPNIISISSAATYFNTFVLCTSHYLDTKMSLQAHLQHSPLLIKRHAFTILPNEHRVPRQVCISCVSVEIPSTASVEYAPLNFRKPLAIVQIQK